METSSGSAPFPIISATTAAKPTFFTIYAGFFVISVFFFGVVESVVFFLLFLVCVSPSQLKRCYLQTMGVFVSGSSLLSVPGPVCISVPIFSSTLP